MALNGANGTTRDGMLNALRMNGVSPETINNSSKDLTNSLLNVDKRVLISIANSVWSENNFVVKKPFTDVLTNYYNAESKTFDETDPKVPDIMNKWIDTKTNGLIDHMLDQLPDNTKMLLINAIYFKGKWASQFDKNNTAQASFYRSDGSTVQVPTMKQSAEYKIYDGDGFTLAEMPYGQGNFVMDIILPDAKNGIKTVLPLVTDANLKVWFSQMGTRKTDISMPRFKYTYKRELKDILGDMGMGIAFTDNADFSNISDIGLLINFILHQALIETNEEGTEAAAVTIIGIGVTSAGPNFVLTIDHPFIYVIRETTTNSILFMGKVTDPSAS
jgi:serpin B